MVTTSDRLLIPPSAHFYHLVQEMNLATKLPITQLISSY
jgi:hypothetical protein